ncbi:macrophage mannose receptor 1-like isoform X2 [Sinocyclocheilus grahami]|uniref:macrophage mannose receptor 1-like isoform X2 n=1 Tax=Sinocyclocheilus grahami TaxID=75366 RepID=UPI0007AD424F|nr:PREDICTED: macrophage mannose receptor 1-like isoform X2 [Sinocyclocheilus grahami]XP_016117430.1 PREDICTED: macrophage mannose receptor 1-like isoform X2 [Sinocyclocheilus grahami]
MSVNHAPGMTRPAPPPSPTSAKSLKVKLTASYQLQTPVSNLSAEKPPSTPAPGDRKCLPGWWPYGRYCYFTYNGKVGYSWPEARHICQEVNGGELASIHSRAEVEFVRNINYTKYRYIWIGLTRDEWAWTDLTSLGFTNWAPGEPNEAFHNGDVGKENCEEMYHDGTWNDNNCMQKRGFVCRHRQYYVTDDNGIVIPTDLSPMDGGLIAGAVIGAIACAALILAGMYYVFRVKGVKPRDNSFFKHETKNIDVVRFVIDDLTSQFTLCLT